MKVRGVWYTAEQVIGQEEIAKGVLEYLLEFKDAITYDHFVGGFFLTVKGEAWNKETWVGGLAHSLNWLTALCTLLSSGEARACVFPGSDLRLTIERYFVEMQDEPSPDCPIVNVDARSLVPQFIRETRKCLRMCQAVCRAVGRRIKATPPQLTEARQKLFSIETTLNGFRQFIDEGYLRLSTLWDTFDPNRFADGGSVSSYVYTRSSTTPTNKTTAAAVVAASTAAPAAAPSTFDVQSVEWPSLGAGKKGGKR